MSTAKKHLDAIASGRVTKSNVIGIRKAINHVERLRAGWSGNRSNVTPEQCDEIEAALERRQPLVIGELHESGLALLRSKRYAKRLANYVDVIGNLKAFHLVRFDRIGRDGSHAVPVYRATAGGENFFYFRNVPWQTAWTSGEESGPVIVKGNDHGAA
jgi:hypothetical protein